MSINIPRLVAAMVASTPGPVVHTIVAASYQQPCVRYAPTLHPPPEPTPTRITRHQYAYALSTTDAEGDARVLMLCPTPPMDVKRYRP